MNLCALMSALADYKRQYNFNWWILSATLLLWMNFFDGK